MKTKEIKANNKKRTCRYCGKPLDKEHYFFCSSKCSSAFKEKYITLATQQRNEELLKRWVEEAENKQSLEIIPLCSRCKEPCKCQAKKGSSFDFFCSDFNPVSKKKT